MIVEVIRSISHGQTALVKCDNCGNSYSKRLSQVEIYKHHFCKDSCYREWYRNNFNHSDKSKQLFSEQRIGNKNARWNGGRKLQNGYVMIKDRAHPDTDANGYIQEHRLVMEKYLNRYLKNSEVVHHINNNKTDNRLENLMLFNSNSDHATHHSKIRNAGQNVRKCQFSAEPGTS